MGENDKGTRPGQGHQGWLPPGSDTSELKERRGEAGQGVEGRGDYRQTLRGAAAEGKNKGWSRVCVSRSLFLFIYLKYILSIMLLQLS